MRLETLILIASAAFVAATPSGAQNCPGAVRDLSSEVDVFKYLENTQEQIYEGNPRLRGDPNLREQLRRPESIKALKNLFSRLSNIGCDQINPNDGCLIDGEVTEEVMHSLLCEPLPTKYESPLTFLLAKLLVNKLRPATKAIFPDLKLVQFGTLPTPTIQAQALVPEGFSEPIIILNRDLFLLAGLFTKSVAAAIPVANENDHISFSYNREEIRTHLRQNPWIMSDFAEALFRLVVRQSLSGVHSTFLDKDRYILQSGLFFGLGTFIIGHELGHIILKHTGKSTRYVFSPERATSKEQAGKTVDVTILNYAKDDELQADEVALRLSLASSLRQGLTPVALLDAAIGAAGADLFFAVVDLGDKYAALLGLPPLHGGAHPPAAKRSDNLDKVLASPDLAKIELGQMPDFRLLTRNALSVLAEETEPALTKAIQEYKRSRDEPPPADNGLLSSADKEALELAIARSLLEAIEADLRRPQRLDNQR